jgi:hypothetical protein
MARSTKSACSLGAQYHLSRRDRDVAAYLECRPVDHLRDPRGAGHVAQQAQAAASQAEAAGVEGGFGRGGVHQRHIARRHRLDEVTGTETDPFLVARAEPGVLDELVGGLPGR